MGWQHMPVRTASDIPDTQSRVSSPANAIRASIFFVCMLLLILAGVFGWHLYQQYGQEIARGRGAVRSLATALDEHARRTFGAVDIFLLSHAAGRSGMAGLS